MICEKCGKEAKRLIENKECLDCWVKVSDCKLHILILWAIVVVSSGFGTLFTMWCYGR
mgnify:CR=1 FL=1